MTMTIRALEMKLRYYVGQLKKAEKTLRELRPCYDSKSSKEGVNDVGDDQLVQVLQTAHN